MSRLNYSSLCKQKGLTLLEILIALSIFAMIGVTSFRLLDTAVNTEKVNTLSSSNLSSIQKTMAILNRDFQYFAQRPIRDGSEQLAALEANQDFAIEFTRAAWRNPLLLERSQLQRVAYSLGHHPKYEDKTSLFYGDEKRYLLRHYWQHLDRADKRDGLITQALMADISTLDIKVITDQGVYTQWPKPKQESREEEEVLKGLEFTFNHDTLGEIQRIYRLN